jgi:GNAT superfamily N-acetyltransferase
LCGGGRAARGRPRLRETHALLRCTLAMSASHPLDESLIKALAHPLRYQPLVPAFFDDEQWEQVPGQLRRGIAGQVFRRIFEEAATAGEAGAFDAPTAHLDRMFVELDERGRVDMSDLLTEVLERAQAIQEQSDARRGDSNDVRLSEVALLHFEFTPRPSRTDDELKLPKRSPQLP